MFGRDGTDSNSDMLAASSKELLYSEYVRFPDAVKVLQGKGGNKPVMQFERSSDAVKVLQGKGGNKPVMQSKRSSAKDRVKKLLPLLKQGQNELNKRSSEENNIEVIEGELCVEMRVALLKNPYGENDDSTCEPGELEYNEDMESSSNFDQYEDLSDSTASSTESESEDSTISELSGECQNTFDDQYQ